MMFVNSYDDDDDQDESDVSPASSVYVLAQMIKIMIIM